METKTREIKMEAVKELNRPIVEINQAPPRRMVRTRVIHSENAHNEVEGSSAITGIVHAALLAVPLWAGIIYLLTRLF